MAQPVWHWNGSVAGFKSLAVRKLRLPNRWLGLGKPGQNRCQCQGESKVIPANGLEQIKASQCARRTKLPAEVIVTAGVAFRRR